jgi:hypothetical protein
VVQVGGAIFNQVLVFISEFGFGESKQRMMKYRGRRVRIRSHNLGRIVDHLDIQDSRTWDVPGEIGG